MPVVIIVVVSLVAVMAGSMLRGGNDPVTGPNTSSPSPADVSPGPDQTATAEPTPDPGPQDLPVTLPSAECLLGGDMEPGMAGTELPDDPADLIAELADHVRELRELGEAEAPALELLNDQELADRVIEVSSEDYTEADAALDDAIMTALGQLGPDQDLRQIYLDLLGEQVAGFYDPDTGELVAESQGEPGPSDLTIIAHELDHALVDQVVGLPELSDDDDIDGILGRQGLVEGDATVLMQQWAAAHLGIGDLLSLGTVDVDTEQLDAAPHVLQSQLLYPYEAGAVYVCHLWEQGGWAAVDEAYAAPPSTSLEILFPELHSGHEPVDVGRLRSTQDDWESQRNTTWGAAELLWLLESPGNDPDLAVDQPRMRASEWRGGRMQVWQRGDDVLVSVRIAHEADSDMCQAVSTWARRAWTDGQVEPGERLVVRAPDRHADVACEDEMTTVRIGPGRAAVESLQPR